VVGAAVTVRAEREVVQFAEPDPSPRDPMYALADAFKAFCREYTREPVVESRLRAASETLAEALTRSRMARGAE
jgi:hypothetical protein